MKNIRRLIIVLTLAVMAMVMMTTASFAARYRDMANFTMAGESIEPVKVVDKTSDQAVYALMFQPDSLGQLTMQIYDDLTLSNYDSSVSRTYWNDDDPTTISIKEGGMTGETFSVPSDVGLVQYLLGLFDAGDYNDSHTYRVLRFESYWNSSISVYLLFDVGPAAVVQTAEISGSEQLDNNTVSIALAGDTLDFVNGDFSVKWFGASLKDAEGNDIPATFSFSVIDATHVKCTYKLDPAYDKALGKEAGAAQLTVSYEGATEDKTFDVTLPASSFWSVYAEEPEMIAEGDETWPEYEGYYKITSPEELAWFGELVSGNLEGVDQNVEANAFLAKDLSFNDTDGWESWNENTTGLRLMDATIGKSSTDKADAAFEGIFDGNYHVIEGLYILPDPTSANYGKITDAALFPYISGAEVKNLGVDKSFIYNNCTSNMYVPSRAGGIASIAARSTIENCWFGGHVDSQSSYDAVAAGIAAMSTDSKIMGCYNAGKIDAKTEGSGIAARYGNQNIGMVDSCYNIGEVKTYQIVGDAANVFSCYGTGNTKFAANSPEVTKSFYLEGAPEYQKATPLSETEFKDGTLLEGLASEAFTADTEGKNNGYPVLAWQTDLFQAKRAAIKEVLYALDPADYSLSKDELEEAIDDAIEAIEAATDTASIESAKNDALAALAEFKSNADIMRENDEELARLRKELADLQAKIEMQGAKVKVAVKQAVADGKAKKPAVTVTGASGALLERDKDYDVEYADNVKPGIAKVTVKGTGAAETEVKKVTFKILPKKAVLKKVAKGKKKLTVKWKKDADATGYQLQYSLKKKFKGAKTVKIAKAGTVKKVIKSLKSGKKYFVRVRSYKKAGKVMLYGAWSKAKNAKVK